MTRSTASPAVTGPATRQDAATGLLIAILALAATWRWTR